MAVAMAVAGSGMAVAVKNEKWQQHVAVAPRVRTLWYAEWCQAEMATQFKTTLLCGTTRTCVLQCRATFCIGGDVSLTATVRTLHKFWKRDGIKMVAEWQLQWQRQWMAVAMTVAMAAYPSPKFIVGGFGSFFCHF